MGRGYYSGHRCAGCHGKDAQRAPSLPSDGRWQSLASRSAGRESSALAPGRLSPSVSGVTPAKGCGCEHTLSAHLRLQDPTQCRGADPGEPALGYLSAGSPPPFHLPPLEAGITNKYAEESGRLVGCVKRVLAMHQAPVTGSWGNGQRQSLGKETKKESARGLGCVV